MIAVEVFFVRSWVVIAIHTLTGLILTLGAAFASASLFSHSHFRLFVPLGFIVILVLLAARYGFAVSVFGSLLATVIFAYRLSPPLGSIHVQQAAMRESLGWMILAAIAISYLLFPPPPRDKSQHEDSPRESHEWSKSRAGGSS